MADLTPETLAAWREDAERERRVAGRPQHPLRILALLDALAKAEDERLSERAMSDHHRREAERISECAQQSERKHGDLVAAVTRHACKGGTCAVVLGGFWAGIWMGAR